MFGAAVVAILLVIRFTSLPVTSALIGLPLMFGLHYVKNDRSFDMESTISEDIEEDIEFTEDSMEALVEVDPFAEYPLEQNEFYAQDALSSAAIGTWNYTQIRKNQTDLARLQNTDTLILRADGTFQYDIGEMNKHETGTFQWNGDQYQFNYASSESDTISKVRIFERLYYRNDSMCWYESATEMYFEFQRK